MGGEGRARAFARRVVIVGFVPSQRRVSDRLGPGDPGSGRKLLTTVHRLGTQRVRGLRGLMNILSRSEWRHRAPGVKPVKTGLMKSVVAGRRMQIPSSCYKQIKRPTTPRPARRYGPGDRIINIVIIVIVVVVVIIIVISLSHV